MVCVEAKALTVLGRAPWAKTWLWALKLWTERVTGSLCAWYWTLSETLAGRGKRYGSIWHRAVKFRREWVSDAQDLRRKAQW